jgi:hypothetical protein
LQSHISLAYLLLAEVDATFLVVLVLQRMMARLWRLQRESGKKDEYLK